MTKLNKEQLLLIEKYLDSRQLAQIDLKYEILDHMANGIEEFMNEEKPFDQAFILEKQKWKKELQSYSSLWIGLAWNGPKIMMKQCEKHVKKMYFNILWKSAISTIILMLFMSGFSHENAPYTFIYILSAFYFFIAALLTRGIFLVVKTGDQSTYRYLFKRNALPMVFALIFMSPLVFDYMLNSTLLGELKWYNFLSSFLMAFMGLEIFNWSRKHIQKLTMKQL